MNRMIFDFGVRGAPRRQFPQASSSGPPGETITAVGTAEELHKLGPDIVLERLADLPVLLTEL